jgi:5-methyltetrahydropteroyltriglutamate--homocysteine methyltransferase
MRWRLCCKSRLPAFANGDCVVLRKNGLASMTRSTERILVTHAGSLPRPEALRRLYVRQSRDEPISSDELKAVARAAVVETVRRQAAAGVDIGNDGEQQRGAFFLDIRHRMQGFGGSWKRPGRSDVLKYPSFQRALAAQSGNREAVTAPNLAPPQAIGAISYVEPGITPECQVLRETLDAHGSIAFSDVFMTAPAPGLIALAMRNAFYDTEQAYLDALTAALRIEYAKIADAGFLLQIDSPDLGMERSRTYRDRPLSDFLDFAERAVAAINSAIGDVPPERVRLHVCWGNSEGPHDEDVPLKDILPVLRAARVGAWVLPFANPRHAHEYRYLDKLLAGDQKIVAGVIDTTTNYIEHPEEIAERLKRVAAVVGDSGRVMAGTDCGFDTSAGAGRVAEEIVWAKIESLAEGARIASRSLFENNVSRN